MLVSRLNDSTSMEQAITGNAVLAYWKLSRAEWKKYGEYEGRHWLKLLRQTKIFFLAVVGLTILILAAVPTVGVLKIVPWDRYMLAAVFLTLLFGGGLLGVIGIVWLTQSSKLKSLLAETGEVIVASNFLTIGGNTYNWTYGELGHRYHDSRTMTLYAGTPLQLELLEVRTITNTLGAGVGPGPSARDVVTSHRAPVPAGKMYEAEHIIKYLQTLAVKAKQASE